MADNADITQSQVRDTRHRRMQEVQIADHFQPNIVLTAFHTMQPSSLLYETGYNKRTQLLLTTNSAYVDDLE